MEAKYLIEIIGWILLTGLIAFLIYFLLDKIKKWRNLKIFKKIVIIFFVLEGIILTLLFFISKTIDWSRPNSEIAFGVLIITCLYLSKYIGIFIISFLLYEKSKSIKPIFRKRIVLFIIIITFLSVAQSFNLKDIRIFKCQLQSQNLIERFFDVASIVPFNFNKIQFFAYRDQKCCRELALKSFDVDLYKDSYCYCEKTYQKTLNTEICEQQLEEEKNYCYRYIAVKKNDISLCKKCSSDKLIDYCYAEIALKNKDLQLCEKIKDNEIKSKCKREILKLLNIDKQTFYL